MYIFYLIKLTSYRHVILSLSPSIKWDYTVILLKGDSKNSSVCGPVFQQVKGPKSVSIKPAHVASALHCSSTLVSNNPNSEKFKKKNTNRLWFLFNPYNVSSSVQLTSANLHCLRLLPCADQGSRCYHLFRSIMVPVRAHLSNQAQIVQLIEIYYLVIKCFLKPGTTKLNTSIPWRTGRPSKSLWFH